MNTPPWIAPRFRCGLGNRLFQALAAVGTAERLNTKVVFLLPRMSHSEHGNYSLLHKLYPTIPLLETAAEWEEIEETQEFLVPPIQTSEPIVLKGFFQNSLNHPALTSPNLPHLSETLPSRPNVWAIHFRFGDYRILPHHQIDLRQYYYHCLTQIPKGSTVVLFSDSPEKLQPIADEIRRLGYVPEIFISQDVLETFKAFAACQGGSIGSNSTFAWWCAFFAAQQGGFSPTYKAYFPEFWITNYQSPKIFTHPFTQVVQLHSLSCPHLESFQY
jgi:hypothetical protein